MRRKIDELGPWFHNIDIHGTPTKVRSLIGEPVTGPAPLWSLFAGMLPDLHGKSVLDIGCNAGYCSVESKRLGAAKVLGVDVSQGVQADVIAQARFAADALGLEIEYRDQDFRQLPDNPQWNVVLFLGVLYHLENPVEGLRKAARLAQDMLVVETAMVRHREPVLQYFEQLHSGDTTTPWAPSPSLVDTILDEEGFAIARVPTRSHRQRYLVVAGRRNEGRGSEVVESRN